MVKTPLVTDDDLLLQLLDVLLRLDLTEVVLPRFRGEVGFLFIKELLDSCRLVFIAVFLLLWTYFSVIVAARRFSIIPIAPRRLLLLQWRVLRLVQLVMFTPSRRVRPLPA